jgi:hypothetical protein
MVVSETGCLTTFSGYYHPAEPIGPARAIREHAQPRLLHHEPLIRSDNMKWRFPGQRAPAILYGKPISCAPSLCAELCGEAMTFGRLRNG